MIGLRATNEGWLRAELDAAAKEVSGWSAGMRRHASVEVTNKTSSTSGIHPSETYKSKTDGKGEPFSA